MAARLLILLLILVLEVAVAFGAVPPSELPGGAESVCVPPGLPPYATWAPGPPVGHPVFAEDARHRPYAVVTRAYEAAGKTIHTWWLNGALVMVDPDPQDASEPGWMDEGLVNPDSTPRGADARPSCRWIRPPAAPAGEAHGGRT